MPARTGQELKRALSVYSRKTGVTFRVASNPEFLREGTAVGDFLHPDRVVVGVEDETAERQLREIYGPVLDRKFNCPVHSGSCPDGPAPAWVVTTINSAELIKHASNSFLAMKISYANMVADLAERLGGDIGEVTRAMGLDPRIGGSFLSAGLGFGGFCFPKDLQAFVHLAERSGVDFSMLKEAEKINKRRIDRAYDKLREALWVVRGKRVGVLGLAFKPNTDDIRFAPAIDLVHRLLAEGDDRAGIRSGGNGKSPRRAASNRIRRIALRCGEGRGSAHHRHRMGRIPKTRLGPRPRRDGPAVRSRRAQPVFAARDEGSRLRIPFLRPLGIGVSWWRCLALDRQS